MRHNFNTFVLLLIAPSMFRARRNAHFSYPKIFRCISLHSLPFVVATIFSRSPWLFLTRYSQSFSTSCSTMILARFLRCLVVSMQLQSVYSILLSLSWSSAIKQAQCLKRHLDIANPYCFGLISSMQQRNFAFDGIQIRDLHHPLISPFPLSYNLPPPCVFCVILNYLNCILALLILRRHCHHS